VTQGFFQRVDSADVTQALTRRPYFRAGNYIVRVVDCKANNSRNGDAFFIVEAEVIQTDNPEIRQGLVYAWLCKLNTDLGPVNVKQFIAVANGIDPKSERANREVTQEVCEYVVGKDQPLRGLQLRLQCNEIMTKQGKPFTVHTWGVLENPV
jgi:hypothetical protein